MFCGVCQPCHVGYKGPAAQVSETKAYCHTSESGCRTKSSLIHRWTHKQMHLSTETHRCTFSSRVVCISSSTTVPFPHTHRQTHKPYGSPFPLSLQYCAFLHETIPSFCWKSVETMWTRHFILFFVTDYRLCCQVCCFLWMVRWNRATRLE